MTMDQKIGVYSQLQPVVNYKLLLLTPELLQTIKNKEKLTIKSSADELVLTSSSKTFQLRQKNHSNTQLLMRQIPKTDDIVAIANFNSELELKLTTGVIDLSETPIYDGDLRKLIRDYPEAESVEQLLQRSPISAEEFHMKWIDIIGGEVDGRAVLLGEEFVTEVLTLIINIIILNDIDPVESLINITRIYKSIDEDDSNTITLDNVVSVLLKFSIDSNIGTVDFKLNLIKICTWYGIHSLKLFANSSNISIDEFLIKWRSTIPSALSASLDLTNLKGHYYTPNSGLIRYINIRTLPSDANSRFKDLFKLQKEWSLEDIEPFIQELNVKNLKTSSFLMKYARVKRQGSKTIVMSR